MFKPLCLLLIITSVTVLSCDAFGQESKSGSDLQSRITKLQRQADSLKREARHLKDSLLVKHRHNAFGKLFLNTDSLENEFRSFSIDGDSCHGYYRFPDSLSLKGWAEKLPKNFHFEIPDLPEYRFFNRMPHGRTEPFLEPKQEKKKTPIKEFKGWYYQELAENAE